MVRNRELTLCQLSRLYTNFLQLLTALWLHFDQNARLFCGKSQKCTKISQWKAPGMTGAVQKLAQIEGVSSSRQRLGLIRPSVLSLWSDPSLLDSSTECHSVLFPSSMPGAHCAFRRTRLKRKTNGRQSKHAKPNIRKFSPNAQSLA